jgi:hypothetical protein
MPPVREVSDLNLCEAAKAAEAEAFAAAGVCEGGGFIEPLNRALREQGYVQLEASCCALIEPQ